MIKNIILLTICFLASPVCAELTAKIESCSGWSLNKLPNLKRFLKGDSGAVIYRNVEVEFIRGKKATMSIMEDGGEVENIILSDYEEKGEEGMHDLFKEKGFEKMSPEEIELMAKEREEERIHAAEEQKEKNKRREEEKEKLRKLREEERHTRQHGGRKMERANEEEL